MRNWRGECDWEDERDTMGRTTIYLYPCLLFQSHSRDDGLPGPASGSVCYPDGTHPHAEVA